MGRNHELLDVSTLWEQEGKIHTSPVFRAASVAEMSIFDEHSLVKSSGEDLSILFEAYVGER